MSKTQSLPFLKKAFSGMICPICEETLANWRWLKEREKGKEKEEQCEMVRLGDKRKTILVVTTLENWRR